MLAAAANQDLTSAVLVTHRLNAISPYGPRLLTVCLLAGL